MHLELIQPWRNYKLGRKLIDVPDGVANVLIKRKIAKVYDGNQDKPTDASDSTERGAGNVDTSEKTSGNSKQRHRTR